jgi:transposase
VWFGAAAGRGHAQLDAFGIMPGYRGTLVRDDYAAYAKYDRQLTAVQLCCAHLIRALRGIGDMDEEGTRVQRCWTEPVISALTDARAAVAKAGADGGTALDAKLLDALRARCDTAVAWGIATSAHRDWPSGRHPGYTLARRLQTRAAQVWRFTADFAVPFTNNPAEQPQRMVKLQMKIGGCWAASAPPPATASSAPTWAPPATTASTPSTPCATPWPGIPGYPRKPPDQSQA